MRTACVVLCLSVLVACGGRSGSRKAIQNKGSDTLVNVAQTWAEEYKKVNPNVAVAVSGGGTGTGLSALINGTVDIANASRKMEPKEIELARKHGIEPVEFIVGYDALAVYVHAKNPLPSLTMAKLAEIYADGGSISRWDQLGVDVPDAKDSKIVLVSRQNNSGTYAYFKEAVLGKDREYRMGTLDMHGSKDVVDLVHKTPGAIGYSGLAYHTDEVRMIPIAKDDDSPAIIPCEKTALDQSYPIARPLFMYSRGQPEGEVKAYLDWILSDAGQRVIADRGYAPVRPLPEK
ncbi:MAG: PstS family phosphate ABC transporter substrate-binding protein [Planctomycetes bacterium]|jgi:phosphate transport system substrate-binding protein|nr:PstS family phosphate ABC transporter substrate-binding protein [Planctomycetota bacterium]